MKELLTPKQVARAIGVSEASLKRWCDKGLLPTTRTAGGHRRLPLSGVVQFVRANGHALVVPSILGLPATTGYGDLALDRAARGVREGLGRGDGERVRAAALNLYLARHPVAEICDQVLAPAMVDMGTGWAHGQVEVYEERLACEIVVRLLYELRRLLPPPVKRAPLAVGGTLTRDPYMLPTAMIEVVLCESGWRAESLGVGLPTETLRAAIRKRRPRLLWLSLSTPESVEELLANWPGIRADLAEVDAVAVVGGRALDHEMRAKLPTALACDDMASLATMARGSLRVYLTMTRAGVMKGGPASADG